IETCRTTPDPEAAGAMLAHKAVEAGLARFADPEELDAFLRRVEFAAQYDAIALADPEAALRSLAIGMKSFAELETVTRDGGLARALEQQLGPKGRRILDEVAPTRIRLA